MKKLILPLLAILFVSATAFGQSFSDDFESYTAGDWIGASAAEWSTWSGNTGAGTDDLQVSDADAFSGTNSLHFGPSTGNGGPEDLIFPFTGNQLSSGQHNMSMMLKVKSAAYFNFQGNVQIAQLWSVNLVFDPNGQGSVTGSGNGEIFAFKYPEDTWFAVEMKTNLTANKWQVFIDGTCVGSFENPDNLIASLNLYPRGGDEFFVDDYSFDYDVNAVSITSDAGLSLDVTEALGLVGTKIEITGTLSNFGTNMITSFTAEADLAGQIIPFNESGLTLAGGQSSGIVINDDYSMVAGTTPVTLKLLTVNGGTFVDQDICNDGGERDILAVVPDANKRVVAEEATGTWCQFCPRGTVWMERLSYKYPDKFIGIAVHDNDPMADPTYDSGLAATSFPNSKVDRGAWIDPSAMETPFINQVQLPAAATLDNGAEWDATTRELKISMTVNALTDLDNNYKVNVAITEDGVTGTESGYAQVNAFSGTTDLIDINGVNWRDLPNPVPASQSVYDHVARAILAPFAGLDGSFANTLAAGGSKTFNFTYTIPDDFDETQMHIVTMITNSNGTINNANSVSIMEGIDNGYILSETHDISLDNATTIFPNPFANTASINVNLEEASDVNIQVYDMNGALVMIKNYPKQSGFFRTTFDGSHLTPGIYTMKIVTNDKFASKQISIMR